MLGALAVAAIACNFHASGTPERRTEGAAASPGLERRAVLAPTSTEPPAGPIAACRAIAGAACGRLAACSEADLALRWLDMPTCLRVVAERCDELARLPGARAPGAACAAALAAEACGGPGWVDGGPPACAPKGTGPSGAPCASDRQCASGICRRADGATCGACTGPYGADAPCDGPEGCGSGLVCQGGRCALEGLPFHPCAADRDCLDGLACRAGACHPRGATGEACAADDDCVSADTCWSGACRPRGEDGAACRAAGDCAWPRACRDGVCGLPIEGEPCAGACAGGLACAAGVCRARAPEGSSCDPDAPACADGTVCSAGACRAFVAVPPGGRCDRATRLCAGPAWLGATTVDAARAACGSGGACPDVGSRCAGDGDCALVGGHCVDGRCGALPRCDDVSGGGSAGR